MARPDVEGAALRAVVVAGGFVPVVAGLAGVLEGASMTGGSSGLDPALDSHVRYLSGLLLAIGVGFWSTVPSIEQRGARFQLLTAIVVAGGLGRLFGVVLHGMPPASMMFGLTMELVVTPLLCIWQAGHAARCRRAAGRVAPYTQER